MLTECDLVNFHTRDVDCVILVIANLASKSCTRTRVWICRYALKHYGGSSVAEGAVDHVRVSSDPADVCHTGKDVFGVIVEYVLDETQSGSHVITHEQAERFFRVL